MKIHGNWWEHIGEARSLRACSIALLLGLSFCGVNLSWTKNVVYAAGPHGGDDAYDFSWLDPDKKIYVLQNRKYSKSQRVLLSGMLGLGLSGPYVNATVIDPRIAYYLSEDFGIEAFFGFSMNSRSGTYDALVGASGVSAIPMIREIKNQMGLLAQWAPWYAKINVFNSIVYFDWYFSFGFGNLSTQLDTNTTVGGASTFLDQTFLAFYLGTGHQYHLSQNFFARIDLLGGFYRAPLLGNQGEDRWFSNYNFSFGVGYKL